MNIRPSLDKIILTCLLNSESINAFVPRIESLANPYNNINTIPELLADMNPQINWQILFSSFNEEDPQYYSPLLVFTTLFKFHFIYNFSQQLIDSYKEEYPSTQLYLFEFITLLLKLLPSYAESFTEDEFQENFPGISRQLFSYLIASSLTLTTGSLPRRLNHVPLIP